MVKVKKDLTGLRFGRLVVLEQAEDYVKPDGEHCAMWKCQCDCDNIKNIKGESLRSGMTQSCGCYAKEMCGKNIVDLVGKKFGRLTVLKRAEDYVKPDGGRDLMWLCECECGNTITTLGRSLKSGGTQSCGCLWKERNSERTKNSFKDITGEVFGRLTALCRVENEKGQMRWKCICECGKETLVSHNNLVRGTTTSCGCYRREITNKALLKNLVGEKFGELTVIERAPTKKGATYWKCLCSCGKYSVVASTNLLRGMTMSCGCLVQSRGEMRITKFLEGLNINFEGQKRFSDCRDKNPLPFDFYLPNFNMCIEYDGRQHFEPVNFSSNPQETKDNFELTNRHDKIKTKYCKDNNIKLLRIPYTELDNIEKILSDNLN